MKTALIFPGQGCQKEGMGKDLYALSPKAKELFDRADDFLGWKITDVMFNGIEEQLMETRNTQPSVFIYEVALAMAQDEIVPDVVAGHSLGEFAALVIAGAISWKRFPRRICMKLVYISALSKIINHVQLKGFYVGCIYKRIILKEN